MNEDSVSVLNTTDKDEIAAYLFERTVIDLALAGREILNKIITKKFHEADVTSLRTIAEALNRYGLVSQGVADPKEAMPIFIANAFVKFTDRFNHPHANSEPSVQGTP